MSAAAAHRARRRFGQHFLVDGHAIARIAALVVPRAGEVVVEVGPGRGALTEVLVAALPRLVGVEIDRDLAAQLRARLPAERLRLIEADILQVDLREILRQEGGQKLFLVGNLPYHITAPFLFDVLAVADCTRAAVFMVQREVAQRLVARPGNKDYGILSVLLALRAQVEVRLEVDRRAFRPVPGVDAAVVEMRFAPGPRFAVGDERTFARVVRATFGQRRKMLRNSLRALAPVRGQEQLQAIAALSRVELTRRPEELSAEEFARLSDAVDALEAGGP